MSVCSEVSKLAQFSLIFRNQTRAEIQFLVFPLLASGALTRAEIIKLLKKLVQTSQEGDAETGVWGQQGDVTLRKLS